VGSEWDSVGGRGFCVQGRGLELTRACTGGQGGHDEGYPRSSALEIIITCDKVDRRVGAGCVR
jgi:hypothetical protein